MPPRSSFRLADNSRSRRRMLLIRAAAERQERQERQARRLARAARDVSQHEPETPDLEEETTEGLSGVQSTESVGAAVPELVSSTPAGELDPDPSHDTGVVLETLLPLPAEDEPQGPLALQRIGELVAGPRPATGVFCGDGPAETAFPDQFAAELRTTYRRPLDGVVNTLVPGSPIETVLENLEWQLSRFHPDVVNLVIGPAAASDDSEFAATLALVGGKLAEKILVDPPDDVLFALVLRLGDGLDIVDGVDQRGELAGAQIEPREVVVGQRTGKRRVVLLHRAHGAEAKK